MWLTSLNCLQNSAIFSPRGPRACPIPGPGFAAPAPTVKRTVLTRCTLMITREGVIIRRRLMHTPALAIYSYRPNHKAPLTPPMQIMFSPACLLLPLRVCWCDVRLR